MISLTIDGKSVEVPEGTTVLRAAEKAGISIPTLCDHKALTPYGGCRLCLVEVEGARTLQPSCTLPVSNNMVVKTDTEKTRTARKFVLTLIFSERNHFCPYCQVSGGDCELQNAALKENMTHWPLQPNWKPYPVDASHPYIVMDHNRCILCRRCVRACAELSGNFTLGFEERGANSFLVADLGVPFGESTCVSCGSCVQVCPTGALIERSSAYLGHDEQSEHHYTICNECSVGCGLDVLTRDNNIVKINGNWDAEVNGGVLCEAGRFLPLQDSRERILTPLVRKNGSLKAATWGEALVAVAGKLQPGGTKESSLAALVSPRLSTESLSLFKQVFAGYFDSNMVGALEDGSSGTAGLKIAAEKGCFEGALSTLDKADYYLIFAEDLRKDHQVIGSMVKTAIAAGAKLVVANSEVTSFDNLADSVLSYKKGSDADLLKGLSISLADEPNQKDLAIFATKAGVTVEAILATASLLKSSNNPVVIYGVEIAKSDQALRELIQFAENAKMVSKDQSNLLNTRGKANTLSAQLLGLDGVVKVKPAKVVYIALGDEEPSKALIKEVEGTPCLIVQASNASQLTAMADIVLPVGNWLEQGGSFINLEGRIQKSKPVITPREDVRSNEETLKSLADTLGLKVAADWKNKVVSSVSPVKVFEG